MSIQYQLASIFGSVSLEQSGKFIRIYGINGRNLAKAIKKVWGTIRISDNVFRTITGRYIDFHQFFIPDVCYIFDKLLKPEYQKNVSSYIKSKTLRECKNLLLKETWMSDTQIYHPPRLNLKHLDQFLYTPLKFQKEFFDYYSQEITPYQLKGTLLNAAPGTGKTYMSYAVAECLEVDHIIVVCMKASVYQVWEAGLSADNEKRVYKQTPTYWIADQKQPYQGQKVVIFHYESLMVALDMVKYWNKKRTCIILDECHNLNEIKSNRTQYFVDFCREVRCQDVIFASGTSIKALGAETIPLFRVIDPYFDTLAEERFKKIFGAKGSVANDIIRSRLGMVTFKVEKEEIRLEEPYIIKLDVKIPNGKDYTLEEIKKEMAIYLEERTRYYRSKQSQDTELFYSHLEFFEATLLTNNEHKEYEHYRACLAAIIQAYKRKNLIVVKDEIIFCNKYERTKIIPALPRDRANSFKEVKTVVKYLSFKIQGECLGRVVGGKRIQCHVDMVPYIDFKAICDSSQKKTLVFSTFVDVLYKTEAHLKKLGMKPLLVYGGTNAQLTNIISQFRDQKEFNPLIATYASLSTSIPLIMADTMVLINQPWRSYIKEQTISRIHRLGQENQVKIINVLLDTGLEPNISTRASDILIWAQTQVEEILGIRTPYDLGDTNNEYSIGTECYWEEPELALRLKSRISTPVFMENW